MAKIITASFDGHQLSDLFIITSLKRGVRLGRSAEYKSRKNKKGQSFLGTSSEVVSFNMDFAMINNVEIKRRQLIDILNVDEPKPLIFSDKPDEIIYAFPKSDIDVNAPSLVGEGSIIWEVPDGMAYSRQDYLFTNKELTGAFLEYIKVDNPGTEPMELELSADFKTDNGFLGVESGEGDVKALFGDMEEIDGFNYQVSEKLFDDHFNVAKGWLLNAGVIPPVTSGIVQQGTFGYKQEAVNEGYAYPTSYGTPGASWTGPSLTKVIPVDSVGGYPVNFSAAFRVDFNTNGGGATRSKQIGHQSLTFSDQNGAIIVSIVIEDNTVSGEKSDLAIYVRNKRVFDSRNTTSYYVTARPADKNHVSISRVGKKITVELAFIGKKMTFDFPDAGIELRKVTFFTARYKSFLPMQNNLLRAINVVKHNVVKYNNIPNKFMNGDKLVYGKNGRNIFCRVNEMNALEMRDVGSTLITAPPGESYLYMAYSSFSTTPELKVKGKARYTL